MPRLITYEEALRDVFENGTTKDDRTGTGTRSLSGLNIRYDLRDGFPLITTKRVPFRLIATELLWFLSGDSSILPLLKQNNSIWSDWPYKKYLKDNGQEIPASESEEWKRGMKEFEQLLLHDDDMAREYGDLGPVYGVQWRHWKHKDGSSEVDQIQNIMNIMVNDPDSRRMVVSAWRPDELPEMMLEPCHNMFQFTVTNGVLSIIVTQRSADMFLGVPFNIASYALLTHMVAQQVGLEVGTLTWNGGDCHVYSNHLDQVALQLTRDVRPMPTLLLPTKGSVPSSIFEYTIDDFIVTDYESHETIKGGVAV